MANVQTLLYIKTLVDHLCRDIGSLSKGSGVSEFSSSYVEGALEEFAWKLQGESLDSFEREIGITISTLKMLQHKRLSKDDTDQQAEELAKGLFWVSPCKPFEECGCLSGSEGHIDPVQFLVSKSAKKFKRMPSGSKCVNLADLEDDHMGAVVFGNIDFYGNWTGAKTSGCGDPHEESGHSLTALPTAEHDSAQDSLGAGASDSSLRTTEESGVNSSNLQLTSLKGVAGATEVESGLADGHFIPTGSDKDKDKRD